MKLFLMKLRFCGLLLDVMPHYLLATLEKGKREVGTVHN